MARSERLPFWKQALAWAGLLCPGRGEGGWWRRGGCGRKSLRLFPCSRGCARTHTHTVGGVGARSYEAETIPGWTCVTDVMGLALPVPTTLHLQCTLSEGQRPGAGVHGLAHPSTQKRLERASIFFPKGCCTNKRRRAGGEKCENTPSRAYVYLQLERGLLCVAVWMSRANLITF